VDVGRAPCVKCEPLKAGLDVPVDLMLAFWDFKCLALVAGVLESKQKPSCSPRAASLGEVLGIAGESRFPQLSRRFLGRSSKSVRVLCFWVSGFMV